MRQSDLFSNVRIADYLFQKDRLFAELNLDRDELALYDQVVDNLDVSPPVPDLVIYLQASVDTLVNRIARRGIDFERMIERRYLERLTDAYSRFFHSLRRRAVADRQRDRRSIRSTTKRTTSSCSSKLNARLAVVISSTRLRQRLPDATNPAGHSCTHNLNNAACRSRRSMSRASANEADDGEPIACLTAYDASFAALVDAAGTDLVLVGDSLGMVIQGHDTTVPVTVDDIVYHCRAVARGLRRAFLVADMPFMSYTEPGQALDNAVRLMQEGGAMMVKLEGGDGQIEIVEHLARHDIPVCAHIGLKPQSVHKIGGFKVQGREPNKAQEMVESAVATAGCRRGYRAARMRSQRSGQGGQRLR